MQFDAEEANGADYAIFWEPDPAPPRAGLTLVQEGKWHIADGHIVFAPNDGSGHSANEVLAISRDSLTLESASTTSGRLVYSRSERGCPATGEREGWHPVARGTMAPGMDQDQGFTDIVVDSTGAPHVVAGGSRCEGFPCRGVGLKTLYFSPGHGCRWRTYELGVPFASPRLLIAPDDTLHALGRTLEGVFHYTAAADRAALGPEAWSRVPLGPLAESGPNSAIGRMDALIDRQGVVWLIEGKLDPVSGGKPPFLYRYDGVWTEIGAAPLDDEAGRFERAILSEDGAGGVQVIVFGRPWTEAVHVFDVDDLSAPVQRFDEQPRGPGSCSPVDVVWNADGTLHGACSMVPAANGVEALRAGYLKHDAAGWSAVALGLGEVRELERRGDGFMLVGDTVWWQDDGQWRAPGPAFTPNRFAEGLTEAWGMSDSSAAFDPTTGALHFADRRWYARHDGVIDATTRVKLTFEGPGRGHVRADNGRFDCASDCEVEVPAGVMLELATLPDEGSSAGTMHASGTTTQALFESAPGVSRVWASGPQIEVTVRFEEGSALAARAFPGMGPTRVLALDDGGMVVSGAYRAGFAPAGGELPVSPAGTPTRFLMRLDAELEVVWLSELAAGDIDVHADGTLIVDGDAGPTSIDLASGEAKWSWSAPGLVLSQGPVLALAAGRAARAYSFGNPPEDINWIGPASDSARGLLIFDADGEPRVGYRSVDANGMKYGAGTLAGSGDHIIGIDGYGIVAYELGAGLAWTLGFGDWAQTVHGDGAGGAWVLVQDLARPDELPFCDTDPGYGTLFHVDATGRCVYRGAGAGPVSSGGVGVAVMAVDGTTLSLSFLGPGELRGSSVPVPFDTAWTPSAVSWSPNDRLVAYALLLPDGSYQGAVGTARFR